MICRSSKYVPPPPLIANILAMILFPKAYFAMYTLSIWIFYLDGLCARDRCRCVYRRAGTCTVLRCGEKETEEQSLLQNVKTAVDELQQSSTRIYDALHDF